MTRRVAVIGLVMNLIMNCSPAGAGLVPSLDLDILTATSDIIVVGEIVSITDHGESSVRIDSGSIPARLKQATVKVATIVKGTASLRTVVFDFEAPEKLIGWQTPALHAHGMYFLQRTAEGRLVFTDPYHSIVIAYGRTVVYGATPIDRVVEEIDGVLSASASPQEKATALYMLSRSRSPASTKVLRDTLKVKDVILRTRSAGFLMERNDLAGLRTAVDALLGEFGALPDDAAHNVKYAIAEGVRDPKAVPVLRELITSGDPETRKAAASALWHVHSQEAIPSLVSLLDDSDFEVRYYSVVGLAEVTAQTEWRPNMDKFRADQAKYLQHWRDWYKNR